jgi:O-acetyl-ADP-ribose deacetylase (regulator of RNase III)/uncharacterized protein YwgA
MITVLVGNLLESKAQTLVNTVNCVGIMGKGIALDFKKQFPDMFSDYVKRCERKEVRLGEPYLFKTIFYPWVLNFPTKDHWKSVSRIEDIIKGLDYLIAHYKEWGITSIAVPPLGCGNGQLEWRVVGPTLYRYLNKLNIPVELYAPYGTPHKELQPEFLKETENMVSSKEPIPQPERIKPGWIAVIEVLRRIQQEKYHWPIGRTTFQKILYVANREGIPTDLIHVKGSYGPFSKDVKSVEAKLVNNGLLRVERIGQMFKIQVGPTFNDASEAYQEYLDKWETEIEKVADLFRRLDTEQAEIVATVLFITDELSTTKKKNPSEEDVLENVMKWKERRKPPLSQTEVAETIRSLAALDWLNTTYSPNLPMPDDLDEMLVAL